MTLFDFFILLQIEYLLQNSDLSLDKTLNTLLWIHGTITIKASDFKFDQNDENKYGNNCINFCVYLLWNFSIRSGW